MSLTEIVSLATSAGTLLAMWLLGSHNRYGFLVGIANQSLWGWLIWLTGAYGLVPLSLALTVIYARGFWAWKHR